MLKELGEFVEALQYELHSRGINFPEEGIQIEIKCRSINEWAVLDQAAEREFRAMAQDWRTLIEPPGYSRVVIPHLITYKRTNIRITYER